LNNPGQKICIWLKAAFRYTPRPLDGRVAMRAAGFEEYQVELPMYETAKRYGLPGCLLLAAMTLLTGCGTTKTRTATEQLLMSDAVDRTIARIDFRPLAHQTVYLDTTYVNAVKGVGFVNSDYMISALRQQMTAAGCLLEDKAEEADYVVEARIGALGTDGHEVIYGIPANTGLAQAATLVPSAPPVPLIPEISVAKKEDLMGAAKIALFAYHRETRQPVWQSGVAVATNNAKDAWIFGAGPFQFGTIYEGTRIAGSRLQFPLIGKDVEEPAPRGLVSYYDQVDFEGHAGSRRGETPLNPEELNAEMEALTRLPPLFPLTRQMIGVPEETGAAERPAATAPLAGPPAADPTTTPADAPPATPPTEQEEIAERPTQPPAESSDTSPAIKR
jgi:hypothetical protein